MSPSSLENYQEANSLPLTRNGNEWREDWWVSMRAMVNPPIILTYIPKTMGIERSQFTSDEILGIDGTAKLFRGRSGLNDLFRRENVEEVSGIQEVPFILDSNVQGGAISVEIQSADKVLITRSNMPGKYLFIVTAPNGGEIRYLVDTNSVVEFGRNPKCGITSHSAGTSRSHASFHVGEDDQGNLLGFINVGQVKNATKISYVKI